MNIVDNFWRTHEEYQFKPVDMAMFFYLIKIYRHCKQKSSFIHSSKMITAQLDISKPVFDRSRNKLKQAGLIDFVSIPGSPKIKWIIKTPKGTLRPDGF